MDTLQDNNRPHGLYGDVYDKQTEAKSRKVTQPYYPFTPWESEAISYIVRDELLKEIKNKFN